MSTTYQVCEDCGHLFPSECKCSKGSYQPTPFEKSQRELRRKLQEEQINLQKSNFEKSYGSLLNLLMQMYPELNKEEFHVFDKTSKISYDRENVLLNIQKVMDFLNQYEIQIKENLSPTQTCYLVLLFFRGFSSIHPDDLGHFCSDQPHEHEGCKIKDDFNVIFEFLLDLNLKTFRMKGFLAPHDWRIQSMDYLDQLIDLLHYLFLNRRRRKSYIQKFREFVNIASKAFSNLENKDDKSDIWKFVLTHGLRYEYGTKYVQTRNPFYIFSFFSKSVV